MKVLLTGGTGQVGTEVRKRLSGFALVAPGREELDLAQPAGITAVLQRHRPDIVLSVGAYTAVDKAEDEPAVAMAVNGEAVAVLAAYCRAAGVPLLQVSTDYVFDGEKPEPYRPDDATQPLGAYGASKLAGERAAAGVPIHIVLRVSWVFSSHGNNFVKTMLRLGATRAELNVVSDQFGGPTWAGHIAEVLAMLVRRWQHERTLASGTYHLSGAPYVSWYDFAQAIFAEAIGQRLLERAPLVHPITTSAYPTKAKRPRNSRLSMQETTDVLEIVAPDWRDGLRQTVAELRLDQAA